MRGIINLYEILWIYLPGQVTCKKWQWSNHKYSWNWCIQETTIIITYPKDLKKRFDTCHFGRNTFNFVIFNNKHNLGRVNQWRIYSVKDQGSTINKIKFERKIKVEWSDRVCRNILIIARAKNSTNKIKLRGSLTCNYMGSQNNQRYQC